MTTTHLPLHRSPRAPGPMEFGPAGFEATGEVRRLDFSLGFSHLGPMLGDA